MLALIPLLLAIGSTAAGTQPGRDPYPIQLPPPYPFPRPPYPLFMKTADVLFLVDATGSMSSYISGVKRAINRIVETSSNKSTAIRAAFIAYRDPFGDGDIVEMTPSVEAENFQILPFTRSIEVFRDFVSGVDAIGGGDGPEDVFGALEKAGAIKWDRFTSKRVLIMIADSPPHGAEFGGDGFFNEGDPLKRNLIELLAPLKKNGVEMFFGRVSKNTDVMVEKLKPILGSNFVRTFSMSDDVTINGRPHTHCRYPIEYPMDIEAIDVSMKSSEEYSIDIIADKIADVVDEALQDDEKPEGSS